MGVDRVDFNLVEAVPFHKNKPRKKPRETVVSLMKKRSVKQKKAKKNGKAKHGAITKFVLAALTKAQHRGLSAMELANHAQTAGLSVDSLYSTYSRLKAAKKIRGDADGYFITEKGAVNNG